MDLYLQEIFANGALVLLIGLLVGMLFFLVTGCRELKDDRPEGFLYLVTAAFFLVGHLYCLFNQPDTSYLGRMIARMSFWGWGAMIAAPAVITMLFFFAFVSAIVHGRKIALYKAFFGVTLLFFVYAVGTGWPVDIKALLTLLWAGVWLHLELGEVR